MAVRKAAEAAGEIAHPSLEERCAAGRQARDRVLPSSHSGWSLAADRPDPVGLLEGQDQTREPDLVPVRHGRMMFSPFTFYRGAATIMAADLKDTPVAGLDVQLCGDAHLSNFRAFASPERALLFDLNDFDETLQPHGLGGLDAAGLDGGMVAVQHVDVLRVVAARHPGDPAAGNVGAGDGVLPAGLLLITGEVPQVPTRRPDPPRNPP